MRQALVILILHRIFEQGDHTSAQNYNDGSIPIVSFIFFFSLLLWGGGVG